MSKNEIDEPGSKEYVKRLWRRNRNESIIQNSTTKGDGFEGRME